jgi:hypothetical protein
MSDAPDSILLSSGALDAPVADNNPSVVDAGFQPAASGVVGADGSSALMADQLRNSLGVSGAGVKVGILSDSFDVLGGAATDEADGDLPTTGVQVLEEGPSGSTDEGRAMLELIHQIAPSASLAFHTAAAGLADFAAGVTALVNAGCSIIVDDVTYPDEPFFQDDIVGQAIDQAAAQGVLCFTSAGNDASNAYQSAYRSSGITLAYDNGARSGVAFNFNPSGGTALQQSATIGAGSTVTFDLQWNQPFGDAQTHFDVVVYDASGNEIGSSAEIAGSTIAGDPIVAFTISNPGPTAAPIEFSIVKTSGPDPGELKYMLLGDGQPVSIDTFATDSGTVFGHHLATGAITVAAANATDPTQVEPYSSSGANSELMFDANGNAINEGVSKPDLTSVDGIQTSVPTIGDFFGTSAAAATAAGAAALLLSAPSHTNDISVVQALEQTATNVGPADVAGSGLINALAAGNLMGISLAGVFLVYRDSSLGLTEVQLLSGGVSLGGGVVGGAFDGSWNIVATGDFQGNGDTDLVYRRNDGLTEIQFLNGTTATGGGTLSTVFDASWQIVGSGDFNGDGRSDLVYRRADGLTEIQFLSGTTASGGGVLSTVFDSSWSVVATGDFNGDGKSDLVYRRADGLTEIQFVDGTTAVGGGILTSVFDSSWSIVGSADFNGDHKTDLVYRRGTDGLTEIQYVDGDGPAGGGLIDLQHGSDWTLIEARDFTGSGTPDLLWRNPSGQLVIDFLAPGGLHVTGEAALSVQLPTAFSVVGAGSYNSKGTPVTDGVVAASEGTQAANQANQLAQLVQAIAASPAGETGITGMTATAAPDAWMHQIAAAAPFHH